MGKKQAPGRADVPGIGNDEATALVQRAECPESGGERRPAGVVDRQHVGLAIRWLPMQSSMRAVNAGSCDGFRLCRDPRIKPVLNIGDDVLFPHVVEQIVIMPLVQL